MNNKGFTLIELLGVIMILSIVAGIVSYTVVNIIGNAKNKTYQVTINNIERNASTYLIENSNTLLYVPHTGDNAKEYNCITIGNLVDLGYLGEEVVKSYVSEDMLALKDDYIYIERDKNAKAISKTVYIGRFNSNYANMCKVSSLVKGSITFTSSPELGVWSREKDITITYRIRNVGHSDISDYAYTYTGTSNLTTDNGTEKTIKANSNGDMYAYIVASDNANAETRTEINKITGSLNVSKIDTTKPAISLKSDPTGYVKGEVTIPLNVVETGSGIKGSFNKSKVTVTIGGTTISASKISIDSNYNLKITDTTYNGAIVIIIAKNALYDNAGNSSDAVTLNPKIIFDNTKPTITFTGTNEIKATKQTATLTCTDNVGVTAYYFGPKKSPAASDYSTTAADLNKLQNQDTGLTKEIKTSGTYYFICKDSASNVSNKLSKTYYKYTIKNMLNTITGKVAEYHTGAYDEVSSHEYIAESGTTIVASEVYDIPTGSRSGRYIGMSVGAPSSSEVTISKANKTLSSDDSIYAIWFSRNYIYFKYQLQSGEVLKEQTQSSDGTSTFNWSTDENNYIVKTKVGGDPTTNLNSYKYGVTEIDLLNYNNSHALHISKIGYVGVEGAEWKCITGCATADKTYSHGEIENINAKKDLCDATTNDCTIVVKVNWTIATYTISYDANGGTGAPNAQTKTFNIDITLSNTVPTWEGHTFLGWNTKSDGSGTNYTGGTTYKKDAKLSLYAKWGPKLPVVDNPSNGNWSTATIPVVLTTEKGTFNIDHWEYTFSATATEVTTESSEIGTKWYKISNSASTSRTINFKQERNQGVYFRVCDTAVNCSNKSSTIIKVDKTAPTATVLATANDGGVSILVSAKDSGSGLANKAYLYGNKLASSTACSGITYGESNENTKSYSVDKSGIYYSCLKVKDIAGNESNVIATAVHITDCYKFNNGAGIYAFNCRSSKEMNNNVVAIYHMGDLINISDISDGWTLSSDKNCYMVEKTTNANNGKKVYVLSDYDTSNIASCPVYTITLKANGGTFEDGTTANKKTTFSAQRCYEQLCLPGITRSGYKFKGWKATDGEGPWLYNVKSLYLYYIPEDQAGKTFEAQWEKESSSGGGSGSGSTSRTFTVSYEKGSNVYSIGKTSDSCSTTGSSCSVTLPAITPNSNYKSVGWSTTKGATTGTAAGQTYTLSSNVTLYANAISSATTTRTFTATFAKGSHVSSVGSGSASCTTTGSSCYVTLPSINPENGYTAVGWSKTKDDKGGSPAGSTYQLKSNVTIYGNAIATSSSGGGSSPQPTCTTSYADFTANSLFAACTIHTGGNVCIVDGAEDSAGTVDPTESYAMRVCRTRGYQFGRANEYNKGGHVQVDLYCVNCPSGYEFKGSKSNTKCYKTTCT